MIRVREVWERTERFAIYVVLGVLIIGEILGKYIAEVRAFFDGRGEIIVLAIALLLVFRMIDEHLRTLKPALSTTKFADGLQKLALSANGVINLSVFANDGTKYYHSLAESSLKIGTLSLLLFDVKDVEKWRRLRDRGAVSHLEIRKCNILPTMHYAIAKDVGGLFGIFLRSNKGVSTDRSFFISESPPGGRDMISSLMVHFESEWKQSSEIVLS